MWSKTDKPYLTQRDVETLSKLLGTLSGTDEEARKLKVTLDWMLKQWKQGERLYQRQAPKTKDSGMSKTGQAKIDDLDLDDL